MALGGTDGWVYGSGSGVPLNHSDIQQLCYSFSTVIIKKNKVGDIAVGIFFPTFPLSGPHSCSVAFWPQRNTSQQHTLGELLLVYTFGSVGVFIPIYLFICPHKVHNVSS